MNSKLVSLRGAAVSLALAFAGMTPAHAAFIATYGDDPGEDKNDCAGEFGKSFNECVAPAAPDFGVPKDTPIAGSLIPLYVTSKDQHPPPTACPDSGPPRQRVLPNSPHTLFCQVEIIHSDLFNYLD